MPCAAATILEAWRIDRLRWVTSFQISLKTTLAVTGFFLKCRVPFRVVVFLVVNLCFEVEVLNGSVASSGSHRFYWSFYVQLVPL